MKRIGWVDFGKGITIFFVMLAHVLEGVYKTGNYTQYNNLSKVLMGIIFTFIMPVFFSLSGYLYRTPKTTREYLQSMKKKAVNLFIPYILFSIVYVAMQHMGNSVNSLNSWGSLALIYVKPIGYLWFLYILFFIFLLVGFLDLLKINKYWQLTVYLVLFLMSQLIGMPYVLAGTFTWAICFYIGYIIKDSGIVINKKIAIALIVMLLLGWIYQYNLGGDWYHTNTLGFNNMITKLVSIPLSIYLFSNVKKNTFFNYFNKYGRYSLIIYLVHAPVTSVIRTILMHLGVTNYFVLIIGISLITWYITLAVCWMSDRFIIINRVFYPYKVFSK